MFDNILIIKTTQFNKSLFQPSPKIFISIILALASIAIFNFQQKPISTPAEILYFMYFGSCKSRYFLILNKLISTLSQSFHFLAKCALKDLTIQQQL